MLNTDHFVLLAGTPNRWDAEIEAMIQQGYSLPSLQESHTPPGRRVVVLTRGIGGWYAHSGCGLDGFAIFAGTKPRGGPLDGTKAAAIAWGTARANEDPEHREFIAAKRDLEATA